VASKGDVIDSASLAIRGCDNTCWEIQREKTMWGSSPIGYKPTT